MNSAFIKDHSTAFLASKGASLWPIELPKASVTSQVEHQLVSSLLSSASLPSSGFSHPKILLPFNSMMPLSGELMSSPEANRLQNLIANPLLRNSESLATNSLFGAKSCGLGGFGNYHRTAQAEAHSNDLTVIREMGAYISQITTYKKELEEKLLEVTSQNKALEKRIQEYEQKELSKLPLRKPIEYIYVPKKKRLRRPATEIPREHKCPIVQCQKSYGSDTSLNLHIRKKHPTYKAGEKETSE